MIHPIDIAIAILKFDQRSTLITICTNENLSYEFGRFNALVMNVIHHLLSIFLALTGSHLSNATFQICRRPSLLRLFP